MLRYVTIKSVLILSVFLQRCMLIRAHPQDTSKNSVPTLRPGRYVPELFGADRGKYMPDESGKYRHIKVPYDGGYGDRGVKYVHDVRDYQPKGMSGKFALDQRDHLRFMIDFNYDSNGWQIIQFEWVRDGDETRQYKYVNENQLWDTAAQNAADTSAPADASVDGTEVPGGVEVAEQTQADNANTNVHVDGEYEANMFNVSYSNDNTQNAPSQGNIQDAIREVLEYIQTYILPTIK